MKRLSVVNVLLCTVLAFASANPAWYSKRYNSRASMQEGYFDSEGRYHRNMPLATIQQKSGQTLCQSASHDNGGITTYVHICESGKDAASGGNKYCFISNGPCCSLSSESPPTPVEEYLLSLSSQDRVTVGFYGSIGVQGVCYDLDRDVPVCTSCQEPLCVETSCIKNTATGSLDSCNERGCTCKEGFAPPDCCSCDFKGLSGRPHYNASDGTCKPVCVDFCAVPVTIDGCSKCQTGYKAVPECCDCDANYYETVDGTCKRPCVENIVSCTGGVCTCKSPFFGANCCDEPKCDAVQDIYFVIDATVSNNRLAFCQTHYGVELMITAMNPTGSLDGTRIGAVFYPKTDIGQTPVTTHVNFFNLGTDCSEASTKYNTMIDGFYKTEFDNPYKNSLRSATTHPAPSIKFVAAKIRAAGLTTRRRIVVVITDGNNDGSETDLRDAVSDLASSASSVTIIAAGNDNAYRYEPAFQQQFRQELTTIANGNSNNVVINRDSTGLAIDLVEKMRSIGAICEEQANEILSKLQSDTDSLAHCNCIGFLALPDNLSYKQRCLMHCPAPRDCRAPPTCPAPLASQVINQGTLERDILAAVEEVIHKRMDG